MDLLDDVLMLSGFGDINFINRIREMGICCLWILPLLV
jgi:hypothetical protein